MFECLTAELLFGTLIVMIFKLAKSNWLFCNQSDAFWVMGAKKSRKWIGVPLTQKKVKNH